MKTEACKPVRFDTVKASRNCFLVLLIPLGVWMLLFVGDWSMRIFWYKWHHRLLLGARAREMGPYQAMQVTTNGVRRGGDLTTLAGGRPGIDRFKEAKPSATNWTDEVGFRNIPPTTGVHYPIVAVGDSFMATGPTMDDTFSGQLAEVAHVRVYNYAIESRGPVWGMISFLSSAERFRSREPALIVWGLLERELVGANFEDALRHLVQAKHGSSGVFDVVELSSRKLKSSLPASSAIAQLSSRIWDRIRQKLHWKDEEVVIESRGPFAGKDMLFYRPAIETMMMPVPERRLEIVFRAVKAFDEECASRGIKLIVLLIPDKEDVYRELLPEDFGNGFDSVPVLNVVEEGLRQGGVEVVNLLTSFNAAAQAGELLYWTDDTHWNPHGVKLAAHQVWQVARRYVKSE